MLTCAEKKYSVIQVYWGVWKFSQHLLGRQFLLFSYHELLLILFGEHNDLLIISLIFLQRSALFLSDDYCHEFMRVKTSENDATDELTTL